VRPTFVVGFCYIRREPLFCRGLGSLAQGIILNAVRRSTANGSHTDKADFPVVNIPSYCNFNGVDIRAFKENKLRVAPRVLYRLELGHGAAEGKSLNRKKQRS
jgi:hypothetical protein